MSVKMDHLTLNVKALITSPQFMRKAYNTPKIVINNEELDLSGSRNSLHGSDYGSSPGSHLGLPSSPRGYPDGDLTLRPRSMKTKRGGNLGEPPARPASVAVMSSGGPLTAGYRLSKSNSSTSINSVSDCMETQIVNQEEILQLTRDVRNFSEALNQLKSVFNHDGGERTETIRVAAHERLRDLLNILRGILDKYTALKSTDIHTAAVVLIAQIKGLTSNNEEKDKGHFFEAIDALAQAFSNSVTEYLMGDTEQATLHLGYPASKSCESLVSLNSNPKYFGPAYTKSDTASDVREGSQLNSEEIDAWLMNLEAGVDLALERAKAWSKYAKDVILYVEKRVHLEMEFARSLSKLAATTRPILREETYLPFQSTYLMSLEHDIEYATNCEATYTHIQGHKFVEQLDARRAEHDKKRKSIRLQWNTVKKEMTECRMNLEKSRQLYYSRYHEYERAKEATAKIENEMMNSSGGTHHPKLDKRKRAEDEALGKAQEAETTYKACVAETNNKQQDMLRVKQKLLVQLREIIFMCDQTMKAVTHSYFQMQHTLSAPAPIQFQTLCEQIRSYEPGLQFSHYVKHHKRFMTGHALQDTEPLVFEPYNNASSLQRERKTSSQSYDSFEDDKMFLRNRSDSGSRRSDKSQRMQAWQAHPVSDSESISGSSTKSASPSASPRNGPRVIGRDTGGALSSGDELGDDAPPVVVNSRPNRLIEPIPNAFKNLTLSKAALTHMIRKLRTPSKCRECESYVYFNGAECERCGLACHKKCLESLAINCGGKRLMGKMNVFGVNLSEHLRATGREVPFIVTKCISEIDKKALQVKGIYRVAGLKVKVEKLCQTFENGADLVDLSESPPHLITSTLKLYLRQLPEPLLTFNLYPDFIAAAKEFPQKEGVVYDDAEVIARFKQVVNKLPQLHHNTAKVLMYHLKRVSDEPLNHMSGSNLGIVFGPTLLKLRDANASSLDALIDMNHHTRAIELMALYPEIYGPQETPVEDFQRDEAHSPNDIHRGHALNQSSNNSTHLTSSTATPSPSSSSHSMGFTLPGSSEDQGDHPDRRRRNRHAQPVKNGHSSDEDGSGSDGESHHIKTPHSPNKPTLLQLSGGSSQERSGEPGGYIPSAYTNQQPQRKGASATTPSSPGGDATSQKQAKGGQKLDPGNPDQTTQRRRSREPRFV
ncbi:rho GTPase-activating protein 45-like isoform X2 [Lytechinus variegatus]|uniref:rho GTPase-activating protein 45-like isoform X2 n=1 Tax=Lytechinus variegatus TaxID=7654 RepID=UPI001BB17E96|nr:rho GTPase-activating protein 45-like isoform X2 [Lytechinus variegatus]